jgi:hypothetical protein
MRPLRRAVSLEATDTQPVAARGRETAETSGLIGQRSHRCDSGLIETAHPLISCNRSSAHLMRPLIRSSHATARLVSAVSFDATAMSNFSWLIMMGIMMGIMMRI